ncbi:hypothetical protein WI91_08905 [Burkholderia vietnamiensis]|nr:hypothetical protein WI91_08905 [Burkholderia vietnamiensis]
MQLSPRLHWIDTNGTRAMLGKRLNAVFISVPCLAQVDHQRVIGPIILDSLRDGRVVELRITLE